MREQLLKCRRKRNQKGDNRMATTFRKLSDTISVGNEDERLILVNNEWTFRLPMGFSYKVDSEFDGGIKIGVDLSGSIKPLVIKGLESDGQYLFDFALQKYYNLTGEYYTAIDCKYDDRVSESNKSQRIIVDDDELYVDIIVITTFLFGADVRIRVRGDEIAPFDFCAVIDNLLIDNEDWKKVVSTLNEIAASICLKSSEAKIGTTASSYKKKSRSTSDFVTEGTVLLRYIGSNPDVVLPDGITEIAANTFSGGSISSIVIPEGVTMIGSRAFENCSELEEVSLPSTLEEVGGYCFAGCRKLKRISLGERITGIQGSLFSECLELENVIIPSKTRYIDSFAFKNCRQFTEIAIPDGVQSIGFSAFAYCSNLEYLYIPDSVTEIRDNFMGNTPFDGCDLLVVHCPAGSEAENYCIGHGMDYVIDDEPIKPIKTTGAIKSAAKSTIKSVNDEAVSAALMGTKISRYDYILGENGVLERYFPDEDDDRYIERIILPDGISAIGKEAFRSKTIVSVVIPEGVETVGESAFAFCDRLETVILPNSLRTIGIDAFSMDDNLTSIVVPEGVETIGENAFLGCNSLETVVLPSTLRETDAFVACDNIKDIYLPDSALSADNLDYLIGNLPNGAVIHTDRGCAVEMIAKEYDYFDFEVVYE